MIHHLSPVNFKSNNWRWKINWISFENIYARARRIRYTIHNLAKLRCMNATPFSIPKYKLKVNLNLSWYMSVWASEFRWVFEFEDANSNWKFQWHLQAFAKNREQWNVKSIIQNVKSAIHVYTCSILFRS